MDNAILDALRAQTAVAEAEAALEAAIASAAEFRPLLVENGLADKAGKLTKWGENALALLGQIDAHEAPTPTQRGTASNWAVRKRITDDELHEWIIEELRKDPNAGWTTLKGRYEAAGLAGGWLRFKTAYFPARDAYLEEVAEAKAAAASPKAS